MEISSLSDMLEFIMKMEKGDSHHKHIRYWYRGQTETYNETSPVPGVYRNNLNSENEEERIKKERHIFQDFSVSSASLFSNYKSPEDIYFLQQHYGIPTRLLDWSTNPLIALYFAVEDVSAHYIKNEKSGEELGKDGVIYFIDAYQFGESSYITAKQKELKGILLGRDDQFKKQLKVISEWEGEMDSCVFPIRPNFFDIRISQQSSYFTFHGKEKPTITKNENISFQKIHVKKESKKNILDELLRIKIDAFFIYKDLQGLAKSIKRHYL